MKIHVLSDLHLEFSSYPISNYMNADVLVLAGDITLSQTLHDHKTKVWTPDLGTNQMIAARTRTLFEECKDQFEHVIMVAGNHEFYHGKFVAGLRYLKEECQEYGIHFLENESVTIDDVLFVGASLWTDFHRSPYNLHFIRDYMNDYSYIRHDGKGYRKLSPADTMERHSYSLKYFQKEIENTTLDKVVVVSHHAPCHLSIDPYYLTEKDADVKNSAYYTDLSEFILDHPKIQAWVHGHTHYPVDYFVGDTRVVSNPRGYCANIESCEAAGFKTDFILEI